MSAAPTVATRLFKPPDVVYQEAYEGHQFDAVYFAMMVFACLIALMGLLLNSPAVIIGAMLISPLMGPILACGLALTTAEWSLGKKAGRNLVLSIAEVILIALIATHFSPLRESTPEILARTNPNLMDLLIAFFSGVAGTIALASRKTAFTILPGVAIATAVMPPLATVGYGIGVRNWSIAAGAFMLFFTNFTAIVLSASLVFLLVGFRPQVERLGEKHDLLIRWRIAIVAGIVILISIPLMRTLMRAAQQAQVRSQVEDTLKQSLRAAHGQMQLDSVTVTSDSGGIGIVAAVQTPHYIEPDDIQQWRSAIEKRIGMPVHLQIQQLQLARKAASPEQVFKDFVAAGLIRPAKAETPPSPAMEIGSLQQRIETSLDPLVRTAGVTAKVTSVGKQADGTIAIELYAQSPQLTATDTWNVAAAALSRDIAAPVRIHATVVATGAAVTVSYRGASIRPQAGVLNRLRRFSAALPKQVQLAYEASPDMQQDVVVRRIAQLRRALSRNIDGADFDGPSTDNSITVVPLQEIQTAPLAAVTSRKTD
ncbi:MAG TPA: TIGR00341 family protein [Terriglobales bacterium]|nr:TIGR00341 family protein [Terriglobales bacterium]